MRVGRPSLKSTRTCVMVLAIVSLAMLIQWDRQRLNADFDSAMSFLKNV